LLLRLLLLLVLLDTESTNFLAAVKNSIYGVADFRDENDFAYIQYPCRDVPWNVSTPKNHTPIQQRRIYLVLQCRVKLHWSK
jgi:hypothetical protein